jgi:hypothetical protein
MNNGQISGVSKGLNIPGHYANSVPVGGLPKNFSYFKNALAMNGTVEYLEIPYNAAIHNTDVTVNRLSFDIWVKLKEGKAHPIFYFFNSATAGASHTWYFHISDTDNNFLIFGKRYTDGNVMASNITADKNRRKKTIFDGKWHRVQIDFIRNQDIDPAAKIYVSIDNILFGTIGGTSGGQNPWHFLSGLTIDTFYVGHRGTGYLDGLVDDMGIYFKAGNAGAGGFNDGAISRAESFIRYGNSRGGFPLSLVKNRRAYYKIDEASGTTTKDESTNNNTGILQGYSGNRVLPGGGAWVKHK